MVVAYTYPQADSFPIFSNGVPVTQSTLHQLGWSGYPINTIGLKYTNIDEGVQTPSDVDIVYKSGLRDEINTLHTLNLDFGRAYVVPSSVQVNIRVNISGSDAGDAGDVFVRSIDLYNNKSEIIANYMTGPGSPVYSWAEGSVLSNQSVILSGSPWNFNSAYLDKLSCNIRLSGSVTGNPNLDNFRLAVYAIELLSSGSVSVEMSGIPLFISGPHPVADCLTVIDTSGHPLNSVVGIQSWRNEEGQFIENDTDWYLSVDDGIHNPQDSTYIYPIGSRILLPYSISGQINSDKFINWENNLGENPTSITYDSWTTAVNSGLQSPVTTSFIREDLSAGAVQSLHSPGFLFNKPSTEINMIKIGFQASTIETFNTITISGIFLRNANGTILNSWTADSDIITMNTFLTSHYTSLQSTTYSDWTSVNNYLTFWVNHTGIVPQRSGNFIITELDINSEKNSAESPNFYFHAPTMNNYSGGVQACFRIQNVGNLYHDGDDYVTLSNLQWKNNDGNDIADFNSINIQPSSSYVNYCVSSSSTFYREVKDRNYLTFNIGTSNDTPDHSLDNIRISEIEICVTGLDPVNSSYIPLYVAGLSSANSGLDLYIQGHSSASSGIDLYINGITVANSSLSLYTCGHETSNSGVPLYIGGYLTSNSGIPLFISGPVPQSSWMPLFLKADNIPTLNGNVPLFTYSTTNSGLFSQIPLYVGGSGDTNAGMILFLKNEEAYSTSSTMPLFLKAIGNLDGSMTVESGVPLFVGNYYTSVNSSINLYISNTQQGTSGYIPMSSWMPLFIARDSEGTANRIELYLKVADVASGVVPLYTNGAYVTNSGIPLVISNTHAISSGIIPLVTHGH